MEKKEFETEIGRERERETERETERAGYTKRITVEVSSPGKKGGRGEDGSNQTVSPVFSPYRAQQPDVQTVHGIGDTS